jgi:hypothetical protein
MATLKELEQHIIDLQSKQQIDHTNAIAQLTAKVDQLEATIEALQGADLHEQIREVIASVNNGGDVAIYSPRNMNIVPGVINAIIDWEPVKDAAKYYVYYNALGASPIKIGPTKTNSMTIPRLQANTTYEAFVRSSTAGGHLSQPGKKIQFTTKELN